MGNTIYKDLYDVIIIGGGIIGSIINYELSKYQLNILQLEKNKYLADETSGGNSGVIHGGFDAMEHKIEARLNVEGNSLWQSEIFPKIKFPYAKADSLVIAFNEEELSHLEKLYHRGITNGVKPRHLRIIDQNQLRLLEPAISKDALGALHCNSSWAIDPVMATRAFVGYAKQNGSDVFTNKKVTNIKKEQNIFYITINEQEVVKAKNIINAAGHYADAISSLLGKQEFEQTTRRGEYRILSKSENHKVKHICFKVPTIHGKGVVVAPMLDGRVMVGPTAEDNVSKEDTRLITTKMYEKIGRIGNDIIPSLDLNKTEKAYSGSRPIEKTTDDFVIKYSEYDNHLIHAGGMQSPAIASAPAIAKEVVKLLKDNGTQITKKDNLKDTFEVIW